MGLHNVDIGAALRRLADRRIEDAMKEGKFDNLPGAGKPLNLEPMPAEENARLTWWALRILKNNDYTPEEIRWRKAIEYSKEQLGKARTELEVVKLVAQVNDLVRKLNTLGTNAINTGIAGVDQATELEKFRTRTLR
jgi:hypothetical protein